MPAVSSRAAESIESKPWPRLLGLYCLGDTDPSRMNTVDTLGGPHGIPHKGGELMSEDYIGLLEGTHGSDKGYLMVLT